MARRIIKVNEGASAATTADSATAAAEGRAAVVESAVIDARERARAIVEAAERRASELVAEAQAWRDAEVAAAREQGREEGLAQAAEVLLRARAERDALLAKAEPDVLQLALDIAAHIVGRAAQAERQVAVEIAARAMEPVRHLRALVLRVNPADAVALRDGRAELMERIGEGHEITVREDGDVRRGGCIVESETSTIDARLETQLEMIARVLEKKLVVSS